MTRSAKLEATESTVQLTWSGRSVLRAVTKPAWTIPTKYGYGFRKSNGELSTPKPTKIMALDWGETLEELFPCYSQSLIGKKTMSAYGRGEGNIERSEYQQLLGAAVNDDLDFNRLYDALRNLSPVPDKEVVLKQIRGIRNLITLQRSGVKLALTSQDAYDSVRSDKLPLLAAIGLKPDLVVQRRNIDNRLEGDKKLQKELSDNIPHYVFDSGQKIDLEVSTIFVNYNFGSEYHSPEDEKTITITEGDVSCFTDAADPLEGKNFLLAAALDFYGYPPEMDGYDDAKRSVITLFDDGGVHLRCAHNAGFSVVRIGNKATRVDAIDRLKVVDMSEAVSHYAQELRLEKERGGVATAGRGGGFGSGGVAPARRGEYTGGAGGRFEAGGGFGGAGFGGGGSVKREATTHVTARPSAAAAASEDRDLALALKASAREAQEREAARMAGGAAATVTREAFTLPEITDLSKTKDPLSFAAGDYVLPVCSAGLNRSQMIATAIKKQYAQSDEASRPNVLGALGVDEQILAPFASIQHVSLDNLYNLLFSTKGGPSIAGIAPSKKEDWCEGDSSYRRITRIGESAETGTIRDVIDAIKAQIGLAKRECKQFKIICAEEYQANRVQDILKYLAVNEGVEISHVQLMMLERNFADSINHGRILEAKKGLVEPVDQVLAVAALFKDFEHKVGGVIFKDKYLPAIEAATKGAFAGGGFGGGGGGGGGSGFGESGYGDGYTAAPPPSARAARATPAIHRNDFLISLGKGLLKSGDTSTAITVSEEEAACYLDETSAERFSKLSSQLSRNFSRSISKIYRPKLFCASGDHGSREITGTKFCFSTTQDSAPKARLFMIDALIAAIGPCNKLSSHSTKISPEDAAKFILIAIKHGGISNPESGNPDDVKESIKKLFPEKRTEQMYETAKLFSKIFQDECEERQLYTGNPNATKLVPLRLKRLDPTIVQEFLTTASVINPEKKSCTFIPDPSLEKNSLTKLPLVKVQKSSCKTLDL